MSSETQTFSLTQSNDSFETRSLTRSGIFGQSSRPRIGNAYNKSSALSRSGWSEPASKTQQIEPPSKTVESSRYTEASDTRTAMSIPNLRRTLKRLKRYSNYQKTQLPSDVHEEFIQVVQLIKGIVGTKDYDKFMSIVQEVFDKPDPAERGTIGHFFQGCSINDDGCSAECAGNLPINGFDVKKLCISHVGIFDGKSLNIHYSPSTKSENIIIHTNGDGDVSLGNDVVSSLLEKGIKTYTISYSRDGKAVNSNPKPLREEQTLTFPSSKSMSKSKAYQEKSKSKNYQENDDGFYDILWLVALIILFIVIIGIIFVFFRNGTTASTSASNNTFDQAPEQSTTL